MDVVSGMVLAAKQIDDGAAVNLGTMECVKAIDATKEVLRYRGKTAEFELHPEMPTGPLNRRRQFPSEEVYRMGTQDDIY
jgi:hypothetical protein